jgi:expansin (peptidoglycan-binding protein)
MTKRRRTAAAWPLAVLAPVAALTALTGCSLAVDLDSLTANRPEADASSAAMPPDALPSVDVPGRLDGSATAPPQDAPGDRAANVAPRDADSSDGSPPEDGVGGTAEDALRDYPSLADATDPPDLPPDAAGEYDHPPPMVIDAAATADGAARVDGTSDALMMCPRLPRHDATLYLLDNTSTTTSCGYARAGLSGHVAAVDPTTFAGSASCGACLRVETAAAVVEAQVVDVGPDATTNPSAVAVNRAALSVLVPDGSTFVSQGVSWRFVPCSLPASNGMTFQFQEGSNASYAALLIQRHRFRLASVEYRSNGSFHSLTRASYNYWVATNGMGGGPFTLRITDVHGHSVEQAGVPLKPGVTFQGTAQFPECLHD